MFEGIYRLVSTWKCSAALSVLPTHRRYISLVIASRRFPCPYPEGKVVFRSCCPTFLQRDSRINEGAEKRIEKRTNEDGGGNMARQGWKSKTCVLHASTFCSIESPTSDISSSGLVTKRGGLLCYRPVMRGLRSSAAFVPKAHIIHT